MKWLISRLKEKSTWLAIFTFASLFGMQIEPELRDHIINAILAVAAVIAFVFREKQDDSRTDHSEMPPIELQGRSELPVHPTMGKLDSGDGDIDYNPRHAVSGYPTPYRMQSDVQSESQTDSGFNG